MLAECIFRGIPPSYRLALLDELVLDLNPPYFSWPTEGQVKDKQIRKTAIVINRPYLIGANPLPPPPPPRWAPNDHGKASLWVCIPNPIPI